MKPINDYEVPHPLDRKGQLEAATRILESDAKYIILEGHTGIGKSALAAHASKFYRVMVAMETKSLQKQYMESYGFTESLGRNNFTCSEISVPADECPLIKCNTNCDYKLSRLATIASDRVAINYKKYILDVLLIEQHNTDILFLDEAHRLPDVVMDNSGIKFPWQHRFLQMRPRVIPPGSSPVSRKNGIKALLDMLRVAKSNEPPWREGIDPKPREYIQWERMVMRLKMTIGFIHNGENIDSWYFDGSDGVNLIIKPKTARYNFKLMFNAPKIVLMSATPGNPQVLARSLGIEDEYEYVYVPGEYDHLRTVYDLKGPRLKYSSPDSEYFKQAEIISNTLATLPEDYSGILHTKSKRHARMLKKMLEQQPNISKYFYIIPDDVKGTENQLEWWNGIRHPGACLIHWAFWEGVSLDDDNFTIVCKTPFPSAAPGYDKARMDYDKYLYRQSTANDIEQACGRIERGKPEHYGPNANKFVAIADGNFNMVKSSMSNHFRNSIEVYGNGSG